MKVGDYVAKITNEWQKHNNWREFPEEKPVPFGIIVGRSPRGDWFWDVLMNCGEIECFNENHLKVVLR